MLGIESAKLALTEQGPNAGGKVVYLRDEDGVTIEFIQKPR